MSIKITVGGWRRSGDRKFYNGLKVTAEGVEFSPARSQSGSSLVVLAARGNRVKTWLDSTDDVIEGEVNGVPVELERKRGALYEDSLEPVDWGRIRDQGASSDRKDTSTSKPVKIKIEVPRESPAANARAKAYVMYRKQAREWRDAVEADPNAKKPPLANPRYAQWLMNAHGVTRDWQSKRKRALEQAVSSEMEAAKKWVEKWTPLWTWWKENVTVDKDQFARDHGIATYDDYHPPLKPGRASYDPKELLKNKRWQVNHVGVRVRNDLKTMQAHIESVPGGDYTKEIADAAATIGLVEVEDSDTWDDGFMWFHHPENPNVLFPYTLRWVHWPPQTRYSSGTTFSINMWMVKQYGTPDTIDQDKAWYYLDFILNKGGNRVNTGWDPRNRFLSYVGGYDKGRLEVHYKQVLKWVKRAAERVPPPFDLPGVP